MPTQWRDTGSNSRRPDPRPATSATDRSNRPAESPAADSRPPVRRQPRLKLGLFRPVPLTELSATLGQLALMLETGNPLAESLEVLAGQTTNNRFKTILNSIHRNVLSGRSLAVALERHPATFNRFLIATVAAGEGTGALAPALHRLEQYVARQHGINVALQMALIYPAILATLAMGAVIFLISFVLPKFVAIFSSTGMPLPLPTRILLGGSAICTDHWPALLLALLAVGAAAYYLLSDPRGRAAVDRLAVQAPVAGPLICTMQTSLFLRTVGTMLDANVPLLESVEIAHDACSNAEFRRLATAMRSQISRGGGLAEVVVKSDLLSPAIKQMIITGEQTGKLAFVMKKMADYLDTQFENQLKGLTLLVEPLMIIFMGVVIGFIALAILMPLFQLTAAVRGGA